MALKNIRERALLRMLVRLEKKQRNGFREYLDCGLFNTNSSLVLLFDLLCKRVLDSRAKVVEESALVAGTKIKESMLDKLCSRMLVLLNDFVGWWMRKDNTVSRFPAVMEGWMQMGLEPELIEREYRKMKRKIGQLPATEFGILDELELEHRYAQFRAVQPRKEKQDLFQIHNKLLESFYWNFRLRYLCAGISQGRLFKGEVGAGLSDLGPELLERLPPLGRAYYRIYLLLLENRPQFEPVETLFMDITASGEDFPVPDRADLYGFLLNVAIRGLAVDDHAFERLIDRIYDARLEAGLLFGTENMAGYDFKNIVSTKLRIGKINEARRFIEDYQDHLAEVEKPILQAYSKGLLAFYEEEYRIAIREFTHIVEESAEDLFWGLEARKMLWKSYFEAYDDLRMDEHSQMLRLYDSFRVFVSRNTLISDYHRTGYENFIRIFNRLILVGDRALWASTIPQLHSLAEETKAMENIQYKKWLVEAILRKIERLRIKG